MTAILGLAFRSLAARRATAALVVLSIAFSVALLLGVEKLRVEARASFANTISGTDLVVGARSGPIPLLLYSVFRIGNATNNISWDSYRTIAANPDVAWTIPISLGDSHRGFRVLGTTTAYFDHYRYARGRELAFASGERFADLYDAVIGADVARDLGYRPGDRIVIDHGIGRIGFSSHGDKPFRVAGVLAKTGTPVDRTVHVSLEAIEAIHVDWRGGGRRPGLQTSAEAVRARDLTPRAVTAVLVGLKSRFATFAVQRQVNEYRGEPLLAILPGVALQELWSLMGTAETALSVISVAVVATGLMSMLTMLLAGVNERRREMAVLRSVGARPLHVFGLLTAEAAALSLLGAAAGLVLLYGLMLVAHGVLDSRFGLLISIGLPDAGDMVRLGLVVAGGIAAGTIPAILAYRRSLADGMSIRI
jgi:putative ABC transport system permease protein